MAVNQNYQYKMLPSNHSIRMLQLDPASDRGQDLQGTLFHVQLDKSPEYEAISYVWGRPIFDHMLWTPAGVIHITKSLDSALRGLRLSTGVRHLWTDAVCIDQTNNSEKAQQIGLMGRIYKDAKCVLAWLGEGDEAIPKAFAACKSLVNRAKEYHIGPEDADENYLMPPKLKVPSLADENELKALTLANMTMDKLNQLKSTLQSILDSGLLDIVALPWFSRVWIIQEIVLAQGATLQYGNAEMDWNDFQSVMRLLMGILGIGRRSVFFDLDLEEVEKKAEISRALDIIQLRRQFKVMGLSATFAISLYMQFGKNLLLVRRHNCSDERDRVYGLLGLVGLSAEMRTSPFPRISIKPDYGKSIGEVYTDFAKQYLNPGGYGDLGILKDAGLWCRSGSCVSGHLNRSEMSEWDYLPSWVPEHRPSHLNDYKLPWQNDMFACTGDYFPTVNVLPDQYQVASFEVALVDMVETTLVSVDASTALDETLNTRDLSSVKNSSMAEAAGVLILMALSHLRKRQLIPNDRYKITDEDIRVALIRTFLANCSSPDVQRRMIDIFDIRDSSAVLECFKKFERCFVQEDGELRLLFQQAGDFSKASREAKCVLALLWAMAEVLSESKFAITTNGMLTLLPKLADRHDLIMTIGGAHVPFVVTRGPSEYISLLIGPCYVHGIMFNEIPWESRRRIPMWFA